MPRHYWTKRYSGGLRVDVFDYGPEYYQATVSTAEKPLWTGLVASRARRDLAETYDEVARSALSSAEQIHWLVGTQAEIDTRTGEYKIHRAPKVSAELPKKKSSAQIAREIDEILATRSPR